MGGQQPPKKGIRCVGGRTRRVDVIVHHTRVNRPAAEVAYAIDNDADRVVLKHVTDPEMPADFLTKWVPSAKLEASIRYATNSRAAISPDATVQSASPSRIGGSVSVPVTGTSQSLRAPLPP